MKTAKGRLAPRRLRLPATPPHTPPLSIYMYPPPAVPPASHLHTFARPLPRRSYLFGKEADEIQKSTEGDDEYMIFDSEPITNRFVSVPKDYGQLNCAAYVAGIVRGILSSAGFAATVTARCIDGVRSSDQTVYLIKASVVSPDPTPRNSASSSPSSTRPLTRPRHPRTV